MRHMYLDKFKLIGTHWIALCVNGNNRKASYDAIYFDSFGVEHIPKEIKKTIGSKIITTNVYRTQAYDLKMYRYWTLDVDQTASYIITLVRLSVCPSLNLLKIGLLVFSDIVHDNSWPWHLVSDGARFFEKKIGSPNLGQINQNQAQN